jgi:DNA-binding FrmR family transcriptional regulator
MDTVISALNRIEGQVRGVRKMYQEGRDCEQIAQQIAAIQSALRRVGKELLTAEASLCVQKNEDKQKVSTMMESLLKIS